MPVLSLDGATLRCRTCFRPMEVELDGQDGHRCWGHKNPDLKYWLVCPGGCLVPGIGPEIFYDHECVANRLLDLAIEAGLPLPKHGHG